ncbi:hypothetical protein P4U90_22720 [Cytobacillus kochii]|uniref:hypothetical protein n=1 Tax=Cytobacillus kochii TaxID=859143 RepID=UPI002E247752|nr:hypothetical protein [Cytobacillus kochii]
MWNFAFLYEEVYFYVVDYSRITGKLSGYLILDSNGDVPSFEDVKVPAYYLMLYNTLMHNTINGIGPQMKKGMSTYEKMYQLLEKNRDRIIKSNPQLKEQLDQMIEHNKEAAKRPEKIKEIYYNIGEMQRKVTRGSGYFDTNYLVRLQDEFGKYGTLMYTFGIGERALKGPYKELSQLLSTKGLGVPSKDKSIIKALIKAWLSTVETNLKKSMATFELDERGKKLSIDHQNIKQSLANNREEIAKRDFNKKILPLLRNPQ